jgi:transcription initiation factor TFIIIB Brf1 subunit/transcription initiation factor TFIIB
MDAETMTDETCPECGSDEVEPEILGSYRDFLCQKCGLLLDAEEIAEHEENTEAEGEVEEI